MKISILWDGAFGSVIASYFSKKGHEVFINEIKDSEVIFICIPSHLFSETILKYKKDITNQKIVICTKGFAGENELLSEFLEREFKNDIFFLYGPTLADEIKTGQLSGMVLAGGEGKEDLKKIIESENLKIELSDDIIGVQIGAALKNVVTIFVGMVEGVGYGQNTRAYVFTKGLEEIKNIGLALGAKVETFLGLSCVGDLTLFSRNKQFGVEFGKKRNLESVLAETKYIPEGIETIKNIKILAKKRNIQIPLIYLLYSVIFENYPIEKALKEIK